MPRHTPGERTASRRLRFGALRRLVALAAALAVVVAACSPAASPTQTGDAEPTGSAGTAAPAADLYGGTAVIALIQEPGQMSPFFNNQSGSGISNFVIEPLLRPLASGEYEPILAAEVPTVENGGISTDSKTITFKLRDGITWSDGMPLTADDLVFTFEVYKDPESTPQAESAWGLVESVTAVNPLTVEVAMSDVNPGYLDLYSQILPRHMFDGSAVTQEHPQARLPLGTGPFVFKEWKTGDRIVLERNPSYWRDPKLPYLDGIVVQVTPERETAISSFLKGDYDSVFFFVTADLKTLKDAEQAGKIALVVQKTPSWVEFLWLNHSSAGDLAKPHPVLGDPAIREAIDYGIDRQAIIDEVLGGFGYLVGSFIYAGWAAVDIPPTPFDPARAKQVLDAAGWTIGSDGIRAKNGVRASLKFQTISGDQTRELYQQLIQQNLRDVGIELTIENAPSNSIFGSWSEGGLLARGNYDIVMSRAGNEIDPADWVATFSREQIPTEERPDGFTYSHWANDAFDNAILEAGSSLDQEKRKVAYRRVAELFAQERVALPVYSSAWGWAWQNRLKGVTTDYWNGMWAASSAAEWYIEKP